MDFDPQRFFRFCDSMQVFSMKDVQTFGVILCWGEKCGFGTEEIAGFAQIRPTFFAMEQAGYFQKVISLDQARALRELERRLPKGVRTVLRKSRLEKAFSGPVKR
jgi:hypothetical protein